MSWFSRSPGVASLLNRHPYYPQDLSLPGFVAPVMSHAQLLGIFFGGAAAVAAVVYFATGFSKRLSELERLMAGWFVATGIIHSVIEGYVVLHKDFYTDGSGNVLAEIWKEYSKADSRYATRDAFTIAMESITAFMEGPLCFVIVYGLWHRRPWRHALQITVSLGQIYGTLLYFGTCFLDGGGYSRPEALYFWGYFLFTNLIWLFVPLANIAFAWRRISTAVATYDISKDLMSIGRKEE